MIVTFLGTGTSQGVPVIGCKCPVCTSPDPKDNRLRTSVHIQFPSASLVIDTGPDFRQQMLREKISRIDALLFTHHHKDHIAGMDDVRSFYFIQKKEIPVFASKATIDQLKIEFNYIFHPGKYTGVPKLSINLIDQDPFVFEGISILPFNVKHHELPVLGFRINDFTYITDANHIPDSEAEKISGSKILVINALQHKEHVSHFNLKQALAEIERLKPEKAYITHVSHKMGLHETVMKELPRHIALAYDGLKLTV